MSTSCLHLLFLLLFLGINVSFAALPFSEFIYPNNTISNILFIKSNGIFLYSPSGYFAAGVINPVGQEYRHFYLSVQHIPTKTVIWTANRNNPIQSSGTVQLATTGITISELPDSSTVWSTPPLTSAVTALRLLDNGNLVLSDASNATVWQSFDQPSDTMISGQILRVGTSLTASVNDSNPATGHYSLTVTGDDALATWGDSLQHYWSLSTDPRASKVSQAKLDYMTANGTALYLVSVGGQVVSKISLVQADLQFVKLESTGQLMVLSYSAKTSTSLAVEFVGPENACNLPLHCMSLGLCTAGANSSTCSCPPPLVISTLGGCAPSDGLVAPASTNSTCDHNQHISTSYINLGNGIGYFSIQFSKPTTSGEDLGACESLCTGNCSCLGFFYRNNTKSCYLIDSQLGSLLSSTGNGSQSTTFYIKTMHSQLTSLDSIASPNNRLILILIPSIIASVFMILIGIILWTRKSQAPSSRKSLTDELTFAQRNSASCNSATDELQYEDEDILGELISALPTRFTYDELDEATKNFRTKVGSGGFGSVYKGELPDKSVVAVKKIDNIGVQGKREFCTEIGIIGNIHHVNLVRLRGFCLQGSKRLLVYEFMNRGSLDRSLFGVGPLLEWQERLNIAVGAARGLAYLHTYCNPKIIHCDVKPENILLHEADMVKIGDFGLAKLLSAEQSGFFTTMRGTRGYLAPEWLTNSAISDRTDVYSFGMVLLELVSGRKNQSKRTDELTATSVESADSRGVSRAGYFPLLSLQKHEEGKYMELADPRLEGRVTNDEVERMVKLALCCLHEEPSMRPTMMAVAAMLEGSLDVWEPRIESLGFLRLYGKRFIDPMASSCSGGDRDRKLQVNGSNDSAWLLNLPTSSSAMQSYNPSQQQISRPR